MIGTIEIAVNAANPQLPLTTLAAYVSSPSHVRVLNVPRGIGAWQLTAVALEIAYPDGAVVSVQATRNGAVWSATFPAPVAPGVSTRGFRVVASGVDENGAPVTGYILGMGDVLILDADGSLVIGTRRVAVRIVAAKPESPREGDLVLASMEIFDGAAWRTLGPTPDIGDLTRVEPYLYELNNAALDDTSAEAYFRERFEDRPPRLASSRGADNRPSPLGACSCVRIGNEFARAYDWKYDESVSFLVRTKASGTRFASIAVCRSPEGLTRQALESKTAPANLFRIVPYLALDGINENGVTCCVNVVAAASPSSDRATVPGRFCAVGAVRRVLDRARTAEEGAIAVASSAWMPSASALGGYSLHFMIADGSKTYVVEDGQIFDISSEAVKAMTNFRVGGRDFLDDYGRVDVDKIAEYDPYGTGAERYAALIHRTLHPSAKSHREWLTAFKYSDAYFFAETSRPDDFAGVEIEPGVRARINDTLDIEEWFVANNIHAKWLDRTRDGTFWQTVHSSVYDIAARSLQLVVQEGDAVHTFPLVKSDSEPADYSTVRTNAAAGAAHAAETGNPHSTTAEQVGVRVVELVVEGDAKKLYLMLNGERTTERVTSYAALLAMAKRGHVRMYYNAVGGTGRKALYTAHMVDDNGTPAMRFDATGTLGEKVYTRSIALTKSGADSIAVTIGELTEIAKASALAEKLDKTGGVVNGNLTLNYFLLLKSPSKFLLTVMVPDLDGDQLVRMPSVSGDIALLSDIADATKLTPVYDWVDNGKGVIPDGVMVRNVGRPYAGDVPDPYHNATWYIDFEMSTDGGQDWVSTTYDDYAGYIDGELNFGGFFMFTRVIVGYKLGTATAETDPTLNGMSADDITRVAEAAIKVNHNAESIAVSSVTLKDGDVASVTMSGTTLAIDFDDARATGGLRLCELYISGATKDADLTFAEGETVVTDGNAFPKCEAGLNYYVFAEVAPNTWNVTRKTLQVVIPAPTTEG